MMRHLMRAATVAATTAAVVTATAVSALAAPSTAATDSSFDVCGATCLGETWGSITWYNRTAYVNGYVWDSGAGSATALFEAFAGDTKIDTETRTANDESDLGTLRAFDFTIGDPDLVGGINRIRVTVCRNYQTSSQLCGDPEHFYR
ncbi:hypothetical protein [Actinoplanes sp. RD1]|uniref:hypothetical protein n=1 Tax=Actinoplanes sp. RD1 TaxID=3064538 RepID=UPI00274234DD|nr:hypothetical protein [Actinoplanes sp. RD1]